MQQPKLIYIAQRRPDYSPSAFTARWRQHAALGMSQPRWKNVVRYLHCDRVSSILPAVPEIECDGVAVVVFRSEAARQSHVAEEASRQIMKADELGTFAQPVANTSLLTYQEEIKPGPSADFKLFVFWQSSDPDFSSAWHASGRAWFERHSDQTDISLVQNRPVLPGAARPAGLRCDGVDELTASDPGALHLLAQDWIDGSRLPATAQFVLTRTVVLHDRP